MKMNKLVALGVGTLLLAAVPAWATLGPHGIGANPCRICHDTANGVPSLRGWSGGVPTIAGAGPWVPRQLSALCYSCHETTQLNGAHDMSGNAYAVGKHGNTFGNQPEDPDGSAQTITTSLPYNARPNMECTSCHNVHKYEDRPFMQRATVGALCNECHAGRQNTGAPPLRKGLNTQTLGGRAYSTHPTNVAVGDTPTANLKTLANVQATNVAVAIAAAPGYALGGHLVSGSTGNLDCGTCHAVHGTSNGTPATVDDLLAINNMTGASGSALCNACHEGGFGSAASVGVVNASDHPIEDNVGLAFRPSVVALPNLWTLLGGQVDRPAADFFTTGVVGTPACSSCHDTHGGIGATALLQHPQAAGDDTFAYGTWCWVCHTASAISPNNHHSNTGNCTAANSDLTNGSQLICNDCHGSAAGAEWTAHNGFWSFPITISGTDSLFCEGCHTDTNPRFLKTSPKGKSFTNGADRFPATHGTLRDGAAAAAAGSSHQVNLAADSTSNLNTIQYAGPFAVSGGTPQWGAGVKNPICESCHNILLNGVAGSQGLTNGWKANLLMEPYEDDTAGSVVSNEDGPMTSSHDFYTNNTFAAGPTGDALCRRCHNSTVTIPAEPTFVHNPKAHTVPGYLYAASEVPYGRPQTGGVYPILAPDGGGAPGDCPNRTTADAAGAPTITSYPAVNSLNCDSCHRPHNADNDSGATGGRFLILEVSDPGAQGSTICVDCHDTEFQCN
jgi:predicted CXXCH cytochrome family protein